MYHAELGRFMTRDPLPQSGQPDVLYDNNWFGGWLDMMKNLYGYVGGSPVNLVDPSGLACCGPDVTSWFMDEIAAFRKEADKLLKEREVQFANMIRASESEIPAAAIGIMAVDYMSMARLIGQKTDYKERSFVHAKCDATGPCERSVTLAGRCVGTNQLGNIMYGILAQRLGVADEARTYGRNQGTLGIAPSWTQPGEEYRQTAFEIGAKFEDTRNPNGLMNTNSSAPVDMYYSNCKPCSETWNGPHTDFTTAPLVKAGGQSAKPFRPPQQLAPPTPPRPYIPWKSRAPCFSHNTLVHTPNGLTPIASLALGDIVLAYDFEIGQVVHTEVLDLLIHEGYFSLHEVSLSDGDSLQVTPEHPIYNGQSWTVPKLLIKEHQLCSIQGIVSVDEITIGRLILPRVYNIHTKHKTFFVSKCGLLVSGAVLQYDTAGHPTSTSPVENQVAMACEF